LATLVVGSSKISASPSVGEEQAEQQLDRRGLARPVGPEQAEDLAPMNLQVQRLEGQHLAASPEVAVDLRQVPGLDDDVTVHRAIAFD
jgi:hypothetical protein